MTLLVSDGDRAVYLGDVPAMTKRFLFYTETDPWEIYRHARMVASQSFEGMPWPKRARLYLAGVEACDRWMLERVCFALAEELAHRNKTEKP